MGPGQPSSQAILFLGRPDGYKINTAGSGDRGGHLSLEVEVFSCELKPESLCGMCSG